MKEIKSFFNLSQIQSICSGSIHLKYFVAINKVEVSFKTHNLFHLFKVTIRANYLFENTREIRFAIWFIFCSKLLGDNILSIVGIIELRYLRHHLLIRKSHAHF